MSTSTKKIESTFEARTAVAVAVRESGDQYGHAFRAIVAHELVLNLTGDKMVAGAAKRIGEAFGYDKGNVSRMVGVLKDSSPARRAATTLDVLSVATVHNGEVIKGEGWVTAVKVGALFARKSASGSSRAKGDGPDVLDLLTKFLTDEGVNENGRAARMAQVEAIIARVKEEGSKVAEAEVPAAA